MQWRYRHVKQHKITDIAGKQVLLVSKSDKNLKVFTL